MREKGITKMLLKVDLQCPRCYKKVKKVLCKFSQIHDLVFDHEKNTVTIIVVCCCPEKIMRKIRCKGGNSILCIEILPPPKPKKEDPKPPSSEPPYKFPVVVQVCPPSYPPARVCCRECSEGRGGGPCFQGHGQPRPCYVDYRRPVYDSYSGGWYRGNCYVSRCDYFCEEYPSGCIVM